MADEHISFAAMVNNEVGPMAYTTHSRDFDLRGREGMTGLPIVLGNHRSPRGQIAVKDRKGLERTAGGAYGTPEAEYRRLIGR